MSINDSLHSALEKARQFQKSLLKSFPRRKEAILQIVESLASAVKPTSVVELSQAAPFKRTYSNIQKAIDGLSPVKAPSGGSQPLKERPLALTNTLSTEKQCKFLEQTRMWTDTFSSFLPKETTRPMKLFAIDATSTARPYAQTLEDRTFVHQSGQLGAPVAIGLQASMLVAIPEKVKGEAKWTLPLSVERIPSAETPSETAERQLNELARLWPNELCVITADSGYTSLRPCSPNQVVIARGRIDRTGRRPHDSKVNVPVKRGRPRKYQGPVLRFVDNVPAGNENGPDEEVEYESTINKRQVFVFLSRWIDVHVYGQAEPVDIVKCEIFLKDDPARTLFEKPLLLIVSGKKKRNLTSLQIYQSYQCRFDIEHFFRFQKQQLLFSGYQTPDLQRQVNWWWLCLMAYWLLYLARTIAPESNRPWMPKRKANMTASPGEVKRVFGFGIFPDLGSPSSNPLPRGKPPGRKMGTVLTKRERKKPVKKGQKAQDLLAA